MDTPTSTPRPAGTPAAASRPAVRFVGVSHRYGRHRALDGMSLELLAGQTVALLGPNGAGKSTAIGLLLGLLRPQHGVVEVLGASPKRSVAAGRVGAMLQTGSGSGLPPGVRVDKVLRLVRGLYRHPAGYGVTVERAGIARLLERQTQQLSGGQAQSVRFALAIAGDPELVFLDEPTAAMDVAGRRAFWEMIRHFSREGRTVVFATHHLQEADQTADRVVVLNHGQVTADGPGAVLKAAVQAHRVRFRCAAPPLAVLDALEGVTDAEVHGDAVSLTSLDADATVRALVDHRIAFCGLEVTGAGLEEAFVALTARKQADGDRA